jgi:hypothetical protein
VACWPRSPTNMRKSFAGHSCRLSSRHTLPCEVITNLKTNAHADQLAEHDCFFSLFADSTPWEDLPRHIFSFLQDGAGYCHRIRQIILPIRGAVHGQLHTHDHGVKNIAGFHHHMILSSSLHWMWGKCPVSSVGCLLGLHLHSLSARWPAGD